MSEVYCKAPWVSISYMPGGKYAPCCAWRGELFDSPQEMTAKVGADFLAGKVHPGCFAPCPATGEHGWRKQFDPYPTDYETQQIHFLDFRNNNLCNLKCRSCGPMFSTSWASELGQDQIHQFDPVELAKIDLSQCKKVYFAGGEPLLNPQHYELLEYLLENNNKPTLMYSTNVSVLGAKGKSVKQLWPQFDDIIVNASIDAVGKLAGIVRSGSNWDDIEQNLSWIKAQTNVKLLYAPVISAINIWWIDQLWDWLGHIQPDQFQPVLANDDGAESLCLIPAKYRAPLIEKLKSAPHNHVNIERALYALQQPDMGNDRWWKFVTKQTMMDLRRNESWFNNLPIRDDLYNEARMYG